MAIFTALVTATKVLASQGAKKAAVSAAKGVVKDKAKNFITGKGKKKKVSAEIYEGILKNINTKEDLDFV